MWSYGVFIAIVISSSRLMLGMEREKLIRRKEVYWLQYADNYERWTQSNDKILFGVSLHIFFSMHQEDE
jgi:hypothetical protein